VENQIVLYDINNEPLPYAGIEIYQQVASEQPWPGAGFVPNCVKFRGHTDQYGIWRIPQRTAPDYDDPLTDEVEGEIEAANPWVTKLQQSPATPSAQSYDGVLVLAVTYKHEVEFHFLDMMQFFVECCRGASYLGTYPVYTNFVRDALVTSPPEAPAHLARGKADLRPVAVAPASVTVMAGERIVLDALDSYDPDGDEIVGYHWRLVEGRCETVTWNRALFPLTVPNEPGELVYELVVSDGIRTSEPKRFTVMVEK
jgi:hypothetical protein